MFNKIPFSNYIYLGSKPIKNQGDSSIDSDSFKDIDEEIDSKKESLIKKYKYFIPIDNKKPKTKLIQKKIDNIFKIDKKLTPHTSTKDTEKRSFKFSEMDKESNFNIKNRINNKKENNRYNNCFNKINKTHLQFLSCLKDEDSDYSENVIDNEISINFVEGFNIKSKNIKEKQVEIPLDNISRINTESYISNNFDNINRLIFSKTIISKNENSIKIIKNNLDCEKYFLENKENFSPNKPYDKEVKINLMENNKNINTSNIIYLDKSKSIKSNSKKLINKYFERRKSQNSFGSLINRRNNIFNLTKKYKIFHKFLSIGIDTSGLYTLDDEMNNFILNPKINYNFPFNNLENELE